jgi:uncharacterized protein (DUF849 family)
MSDFDFSKCGDIPTFAFQPFSKVIMDFAAHPPWKIPPKVAVIAAPTGATFTKEQNPHQPYDVEEIIRESIGCVEAGACSVHVHVRDSDGIPTGDRKLTKRVVTALRERFGGRVHIDGEALFGNTFEEMMEPIKENLYESSAVNCLAAFMGDTIAYLPPQTCKMTARVLQHYGKGVVLAVYNPGDIDNTYRWLIQPGIVRPPFLWGVCPGMPGGSPMWNPLSMVETLVHMLRRIRDVDPSPYPNFVVTASGRASSHLTTLAMLLGGHVRVGMEDTVFQVPHRDDVITSNREVVEQTIAIARSLGREPMTAVEYREMGGIIPFPT